MLNRISLLQKKLPIFHSYPSLMTTCHRKPHYAFPTQCLSSSAGEEDRASTTTQFASGTKGDVQYKLNHVVAKENLDIHPAHPSTTQQRTSTEMSQHHQHKEHEHDDDDDEKVHEEEMEQEDMFVAPDISLGTDKIEWGGPRRGGRYAEPTRFGDWERKGRCTDF